MKFRTKLTLSYIVLVIIVMIISFVALSRAISIEFDRFLLEKNTTAITKLYSEIKQKRLEHGIDKNKNRFIDFITNKPIRRIGREQRFIESIHLASVFSGLIGLFFAITLGWWISKIQTKKIEELKNALLAYKNDGIMMKLSNESNDEIGELIKSYNELIQQLNKQQDIRKEFFTDMSHELRTPLTSIRSYIEGISDGVIQPNKKVLKNTLQEISRMNNLIKELLNLSRIESETITLQKESIELKELTEHIVNTLYISNKKYISIKNNAFIYADQDKIKQVIINLISNAISYRKLKTQINIELEETNKFVFFKISNLVDNISNIKVELLFERFYREDKSREYNHSQPHLGIGLTIAKKIIEAHNGKITIENNNNLITVIVKLPK